MSDPPKPASGRSDPDDGLFAPPPDTSPRGRRLLTVVAWLCAAAALVLPVIGVVGMVTGTLGHVKGDRAGLPAAVAAGITTIVGMALLLGLR